MRTVTNREWLPGELLSGSECQRPGWFLDMKYQTCNHMRLRWRPGNTASRRELVPSFTECRICCSSYQAHYMCKCCRAHVWVCGGQLFCREHTNSKLDDENDYYLVLWWKFNEVCCIVGWVWRVGMPSKPFLTCLSFRVILMKWLYRPVGSIFLSGTATGEGSACV